MNILKNTKLLIALLCVLLVSLSGCDNSEYHRAKVKCNKEQLELVRSQMDICTETGYLDSFCYDRARAEQCDLVDDQKANQLNRKAISSFGLLKTGMERGGIYL